MPEPEPELVGLPNPYVIDPATGLPALPEGWVWVVKRWKGERYDYEVNAYIKRKYWFGHYKSKHYWTLFDGHKEKDLQDAARTAVIVGNDRVREAAKKKHAAPLSGAYPPKRVGGSGT